MRLFIAVFPPAHVQQVAHSVTDSLRASDPKVSWVRPENLHFTMRFLGECEPEARERAETAMRRAAKAHKMFGAALGGFGAFPTARKARVLWLGLLQGAEPIRLLSESLEQALKKGGFEPSDESFEPHLTVGRVRTPGDWTERLLDAPSPEARFQIDRLSLVQSALGPGGARYEVLATAELQPLNG